MIQNSTQTSERGSVLFYILLGVVLFAALSYAVSGMMRGSGGDVGSEKAGIYASEILTYAASMRDAVQRMRVSNGCADEDISFEHSPFDGSDVDYVNPNSPSDFLCHVFHPNGGGITPLLAEEEVNGAVDWWFSGVNRVPDVGVHLSSDLVMVLPNVKQKICLEYNTKLGVSNPSGEAPLDTDSVYTTPFKGSYVVSTQIGSSADLETIMSACYKHVLPDPDTYNIYQVLIAR